MSYLNLWLFCSANYKNKQSTEINAFVEHLQRLTIKANLNLVRRPLPASSFRKQVYKGALLVLHYFFYI